MVKDFRCYVVGCSQVNKRRDHMIIHVGSHLNQRPFQCAHCPSRFLRKNECKRHELSHVDFKPFVCPQCPVGSGGFGRQDLLTRHMRNTHHMEPEKPKKKDKENSRPRKKAKKSQ
ncbi:hypothetical protein B0H10DRAFT_1779652 [Mycena sp. CBHHK59/15]|nr:hypothetical protein B0H10DRAFT_1779652 [Mycena sp. CBHHK59/15]